MTKQRTLFINSRNRLNGTSSNFTIKLDEIINDTDYDYISLLSASIPKSYYLISNDALFTIDETGEAGGTVRSITVPKGNYNRINMRNKLISLMNTGAPAGVVYDIVYGYGDQTNSGETGRYSFSVSGNASQPTITFNGSSLKLPSVLGFANGSDITPTTYTFSGNALIPPNMCNFNYEQFVYIKSDICEEKNNIIEVVYMDKIPYLSFTDFYNEDYRSTQRTLRMDMRGNDTFTFYISNAEGEELNLNGIDLSLVLVVWTDSHNATGDTHPIFGPTIPQNDILNPYPRDVTKFYRSTG